FSPATAWNEGTRANLSLPVQTLPPETGLPCRESRTADHVPALFAALHHSSGDEPRHSPLTALLVKPISSAARSERPEGQLWMARPQRTAWPSDQRAGYTMSGYGVNMECIPLRTPKPMLVAP